ncbi:PREDICTED: PRUPE_3G297500, partial [Prunus dulcis]
GAMHQSMETYKGKFIPATASAIKGLEKVRVKGLGLGADKVCVICMEGFEVGLGADK